MQKTPNGHPDFMQKPANLYHDFMQYSLKIHPDFMQKTAHGQFSPCAGFTFILKNSIAILFSSTFTITSNYFFIPIKRLLRESS